MLGSLIRLALMVLVGVVVYNYFFGSPTEKATSNKIFGEVRGVFGSVRDLVKTEKEKYEAGKYNQAIDKISNVIGTLKGKAQEVKDSGVLDKLSDLEAKRTDLQKRVERTKTALGAKDTLGIKQSFEDLVKETDKMIQNMEKSKDFVPN
jgi:cytochrome c556